MKRSLVVLGILAASDFLTPNDAAAQRGGADFRGGAPSFRSGGGGMAFRPPIGGSAGIGMAGPRGFGGPGLVGRPSFRGGAVDIRPWGLRPAIAAPGFRGYGRVVSVGRPAYRGYYGYRWGYPYYGRSYPYFGGALLAGLTLGALSYPYYGYDPYLYTGAAYEGDCYWIRRPGHRSVGPRCPSSRSGLRVLSHVGEGRVAGTQPAMSGGNPAGGA